MKTNNYFCKVLVYSFIVFLTACTEDKPDLANYVAEVKATQKSDIEPIPVMKPYQKFSYAAADLRDPFTATIVDLETNDADKQAADNGISPDKHRRKEALESYSLSELQYVGTLEKENVWALVRASDGIINRVQVGNYMGLNNGKVTAISLTQIELQEIVSTGTGRYSERTSTLPIVEVN